MKIGKLHIGMPLINDQEISYISKDYKFLI